MIRWLDDDEEHLRSFFRGKDVVFTNGCFDIFHIGHLSTLNFAAKERATFVYPSRVQLVVGLNSDQSVKRQKGNSRPIFDEIDRAKVLSAIDIVDDVIIFDENTPERLIDCIRPKVWVKGSDYSEKQLRELVKVPEECRISLAPIVRGTSTTDLIRKIKNA